MLTDKQKELAQLLKDGRIRGNSESFAKDMSSKRLYTSKQHYWVEKLVNEALPLEKLAPKVKLDLTQIVRMFDFAANHLKFPKVKLLIGDGPVEERATLKITRSGPESRNPGTLWISQSGYGSPTYGRISPDGTMTLNDKAPTGTREILEAFALNPDKIASEHGKLLGHCVFCLAALTDDRSLFVGYGPICAKHYNLNWGNTIRREFPTFDWRPNETVPEDMMVF